MGFVAVIVLSLAMVDLQCKSSSTSLSECKNQYAQKYKMIAVYNSIMNVAPLDLMKADISYKMSTVIENGDHFSIDVFSLRDLSLKQVIAVCLVPRKSGTPGGYTIVETFTSTPTYKR